jgi:hypothetical protein
MSVGLTPGAVLPDFELPDENGVMHRLSALQGDDAMVLKLQLWQPVAFTQMVTVLPNDLHDTYKMKIATGAQWTYLADADLEVQAALDIREYTDAHHAATVPHTLVLGPGLTIDRVYVGYWYWGRPSPYQLWEDLQALMRRAKADYDPTTAEARAAWEAAQREVAAA